MKPCFLLLLLFIAHNQSPAQKPVKTAYTYYHASMSGGLCSASVLLYSNGNYFWEQGCESSSYINYGRWRTKKDTIFFSTANIATFKIIDTVLFTPRASDSISVTILNKNGENITYSMALGLRVPGTGVYPFGDGNKGDEKVAYKRNKAEIYLKTLSRVFNQSFTVPAAQAGHYTIRLGIPPEWGLSPKSEWNSSSVAFLLKKDSVLIGPHPYFVQPVTFVPRER